MHDSAPPGDYRKYVGPPDDYDLMAGLQLSLLPTPLAAGKRPDTLAHGRRAVVPYTRATSVTDCRRSPNCSTGPSLWAHASTGAIHDRSGSWRRAAATKLRCAPR